MDRALLTDDDRAWLAKHGDACRKGCDFILYNLCKKNTEQDQNHAGVVPIWYGGDYVQASEVLRAIEQKVPHSQIFEQWESRVYQDVMRACSSLSAFDASVLHMASGFHLTTEEAIYEAASEAVDEAYEALYGCDEDHC